MAVSDKLKSVFCLQEREKLVSLEGKYAELSERQTFTNNPVAIKEVTVTVTLEWNFISTRSCFTICSERCFYYIFMLCG